MFALGSSHRFYLYDSHCDMRKSFDGLCGLIKSVMQREATSGEVFVFLNRSRTHIKLLHWKKEALCCITNVWKAEPFYRHM